MREKKLSPDLLVSNSGEGGGGREEEFWDILFGAGAHILGNKEN